MLPKVLFVRPFQRRSMAGMTAAPTGAVSEASAHGSAPVELAIRLAQAP